MALNRLVRKVRRNISDYGWWVTAKKSLAEILSPIYRHRVYRIYRIDLARTDPPPPSLTGEFEFRMLRPTDTDEISHVAHYAEWLHDNLADKLTGSAICLVALQNEDVAGFNLVSFGKVYVPLLEMTRELQAQEAWSEHIAVHKPYRQMGLGSELRSRIFEDLKSRGIKRLYGGTLSSNLPSLKLARRMGFKELVDVHFVCILGFRSWSYRKVRENVTGAD